MITFSHDLLVVRRYMFAMQVRIVRVVQSLQIMFSVDILKTMFIFGTFYMTTTDDGKINKIITNL